MHCFQLLRHQQRGIDSVQYPERFLDVVEYLCNDELFVADASAVAVGDGDDEDAGDGDEGTGKVAELSELGADADDLSFKLNSDSTRPSGTTIHTTTSSTRRRRRSQSL